MLLLDLGVFHKKSHEVSFKEATTWSAVWVTLSTLFGSYLYFNEGHEKGLAFAAGYLVELSLSLDNIFVFIMIFRYFRVPGKFQHKILFWGILSAVIFRIICILTGVALIQQFHWTLYILGAFLVFTGIKMLLHKEDDNDEPEFEPEHNWLVKICKKFLPFTDKIESDAFLVKQNGRWMGTPLLIVLLIVETTDVMFAADSIPAVLAISQDPFIVYTSNIFAILGLRSMYFMLNSLMLKFRFLPHGIGLILVFVGCKMLAEIGHIEIPITTTLAVIAGLITSTVVLSLLFKPAEKPPTEKPPAE